MKLLGIGGFVSPAWVGKNPAGSVSNMDPEINFYTFNENGSVVRRDTYISNGNVTLIENSGNYALDEANNILYIIYDDTDKTETEIHYEFDGSTLKMYGGWYGCGVYNDSFKTEIFKANWQDLMVGIGRQNVDYINNLAKDNPDLVPDFFTKNKENSEITSKLVGEWGLLGAATWYEESYGTYKCRPSVYVVEFLEDGKLIFSYTKPDEDGISIVEGTYYVNENNKKIQIGFGTEELDDTELVYENQDNELVIYMGFYHQGRFNEDIKLKLTKDDWSALLEGIDELSLEKRDGFINSLIENNPDYVPSYYRK